MPEALDDDWFTPEEIAEVFGLDSVHLVDGSGFVVLGGGGTGYGCKYGLGDTTDTIDTTATAETATESTAGDDTAPDETAPDDTGADEDPTLVEFLLWDSPLSVDADTPGVLEVFSLPPAEDTDAEDQTSTMLIIADGFNGDVIDPEFAERWLTAARDRMA